jgi:imidazole glycerol phosphate synthase subunit HisF
MAADLSLLSGLAQAFGAQSVVASVDVKEAMASRIRRIHARRPRGVCRIRSWTGCAASRSRARARFSSPPSIATERWRDMTWSLCDW